MCVYMYVYESLHVCMNGISGNLLVFLVSKVCESFIFQLVYILLIFYFPSRELENCL